MRGATKLSHMNLFKLTELGEGVEMSLRSFAGSALANLNEQA